jgi:membrane-bound metal-dependent hydrolase YbcI (DUF457 family)
MDNDNFKKQSITITVGSILASCLHGIIGYIAVYFFQPIWDKLVSYWNKK